MNEIWKSIVGYEGLYEVSNLGNVKSLDKVDTLGRFRKGKIMSQSLHKDGYLQLSISKNGVSSKKLIHRLVAEAFLEKVNGKDKINHIDGNKLNNSVINLEWCTDKENSEHAWKHGLNKITDEQKAKMSANRKGKCTGKDHPMYGKKLSEERKAKLKEVNKKRASMGKHPMLGKKHTDEAKEKMRLARIGNTHSAKKVVCIDTGKVYNSTSHAERELKLPKGKVSAVCRGERSKTGGYKFKYLD